MLACDGLKNRVFVSLVIYPDDYALSLASETCQIYPVFFQLEVDRPRSYVHS